MALKYKRCYP